MKPRADSLHGGRPETADTALLLIDVINHLEFDGAEALLRPALRMADRLAALRARARAAGLPVIYVNDNFGRWRSDFRSLVDDVTAEGVRGRPLAERLLPDEDDYFVLKPMHSGFYGTSLEPLLAHLGVERLILGGVQTDNCVLFTANDAYMRGFRVLVPADCCAAERPDHHESALSLMRRVVKADVRPSSELDPLPAAAPPD